MTCATVTSLYHFQRHIIVTVHYQKKNTTTIWTQQQQKVYKLFDVISMTLLLITSDCNSAGNTAYTMGK